MTRLLAEHGAAQLCERFFAAKGQAAVASYLAAQRDAAHPKVA